MTSGKKGKAKRVVVSPAVESINDAGMVEASAAVEFPVVGIGASAGGLAAFESFFSGMPADRDPGMAFILVQHLAPDHKSILTELVRRYTRMEVFEVEDGMRVQINCAYIIPPNRDMAFINGSLQLLEPFSPRGQRLPIDFFFRSLAEDQRGRAIGIVLSGTGGDGTLGVRAIKGEGGMVMVQKPESADYDGMPRSALATGLADYELPPSEMPAQLMAYVDHSSRKPFRPAAAPESAEENTLRKIFILLRTQTGHDFSQYKPSTVHRRIERRMAVNQIGTLEDYVKHLRQAPAEVEALFRDLLIGVTNFFRDPEAFKALEEHIVPNLFAGKQADGVVRVWVPGCSTGEEAYSIAILLQERMETLRHGCKAQVFATDIDSHAIATARAGVYPASIAADITPERLDRFFTIDPGGDTYRIRKGIRDLMVFSEHDVIKDPPFSKLDLISCRNLLIYLGGALQKRLIPLFHYALNPGGALFLGTSETVGECAHLFTTLDRKFKLYRRKDFYGTPRPAMDGLTHFMTADRGDAIPPAGVSRQSSGGPAGRRAAAGKWSLRELTERALLRQVAKAAALVNGNGDIFYLHGRTGSFLAPCPGEIRGNNVLKMAREGLQRELSMALRKAVETQATARRSGLRVKTNGGFSMVDLAVHPVDPQPGLSEAAPGEALYLVSFGEAPDPPAAKAKDGRTTASTDHGDSSSETFARIESLERELRAKEEYLQATTEELETSNEELKSSNEELQSVNEELQSSNEELETSKEELQSVNEELSTVNSELQTKVADLSRANNDMNNLLAGTGIGTIFVDHQSRIMRFTTPAARIINLIQTDVGRPVGHIVSNLVGYDRLVADVQMVLDSLIPIEMEVRTPDSHWYTMRIQPYRTLDNVIEGAVITFVDITEARRVREALKDSEGLRRLAVVVRDAYDAIIVHDLDGRVLAWNPAAERLYGWSEAEALTMNVRDMVPAELREEALSKMRRMVKGEVLEPCRARRLTKDGRTVDVWQTTTALVDEAGKIYAIAATEREIKGGMADG